MSLFRQLRALALIPKLTTSQKENTPKTNPRDKWTGPSKNKQRCSQRNKV